MAITEDNNQSLPDKFNKEHLKQLYNNFPELKGTSK
jgi:hypothetical protein